MQSTRSKPKGRRAYEYLCGGWNRGKRKCKKGAIPQSKLEAVVIKEVVDFYTQYRGSKGRERCLQAIRRRIELEERAVSSFKGKLQAEIEKLDRNHVNPSQGIYSAPHNIASQNPPTHDRKRALIARRLESLNYIALSQKEIPELLDRLRTFIAKFHRILRGTDQEERLSSIRRCIVGILIDVESQQAQIELREVPMILSVLDVGPTKKIQMYLSIES